MRGRSCKQQAAAGLRYCSGAAPAGDGSCHRCPESRAGGAAAGHSLSDHPCAQSSPGPLDLDYLFWVHVLEYEPISYSCVPRAVRSVAASVFVREGIRADGVFSLSHIGGEPIHRFCVQEVMRDAVILADGHTYSQPAIQQWLSRHDTSPLTNARLPHTQLIPNYAIRAAAQAQSIQSSLLHILLIIRSSSPHLCQQLFIPYNRG